MAAGLGVLWILRRPAPPPDLQITHDGFALEPVKLHAAGSSVPSLLMAPTGSPSVRGQFVIAQDNPGSAILSLGVDPLPVLLIASYRLLKAAAQPPTSTLPTPTLAETRPSATTARLSEPAQSALTLAAVPDPLPRLPAMAQQYAACNGSPLCCCACTDRETELPRPSRTSGTQ